MRYVTVLATFLLGFVPHCVASAAEPSGTPTGIYSSLSESGRSGDLVGIELFVLQGATGYFGVLQGSEGAPGNPIAVPLQVNGNSVRFSIPPGCACGLPEGAYEAQLSLTSAKLRGPGNFGEKQLPRTNSFWQRK